MDEQREPDAVSRTTAIVLLLTSAAAQIAYGAAALTGLGQLKANIHDIERDPRYGTLYFSLGTWGVLLALAGALTLLGAWRIARRTPQARLIALAATMLALVVAFFTLAIFHLAALATVILLLMTLYLLSYRVND